MSTERLPAVPEREPSAAEIDRIVVLYYAHDGSRTGFELTGVRDVAMEVRRDVDAIIYHPLPLTAFTTDELELTITASRYKVITQAPEQEPTDD